MFLRSVHLKIPIFTYKSDTKSDQSDQCHTSSARALEPCGPSKQNRWGPDKIPRASMWNIKHLSSSSFHLSTLNSIFSIILHHGPIKQTLGNWSGSFSSPTHPLHQGQHHRSFVAHWPVSDCAPVWRHCDLVGDRRPGAAVHQWEVSSGWFQAYPWWYSAGVPGMWTLRFLGLNY